MDIYDELGVRKIINGSATLTMLGGSLMPPVVLEAMQQPRSILSTSMNCRRRSGSKIAEWTHNEAAYVSCGAAAGLVLSTAACIAGMDPEKRARLPFSDGMKNEIIVHRAGGWAMILPSARPGASWWRSARSRAPARRSWKPRSTNAPRRSLFSTSTCMMDGPGAAGRADRDRQTPRHAVGRGRGGAAPAGGKPVVIHPDGRRPGALQRRQRDCAARRAAG